MATLAASAPRQRLGGAVAQLGERLVRNEEVRGSTPLGSTTCATESSASQNLIAGLMEGAPRLKVSAASRHREAAEVADQCLRLNELIQVIGAKARERVGSTSARMATDRRRRPYAIRPGSSGTQARRLGACLALPLVENDGRASCRPPFEDLTRRHVRPCRYVLASRVLRIDRNAGPHPTRVSRPDEPDRRHAAIGPAPPAVRAVLERADLCGRGLPDGGRGRRLADVRAHRQRARPRADRPDAVPAGGGIDAGGGAGRRPLRPPPPAADLPGGRGRRGRNAGARVGHRMGEQGIHPGGGVGARHRARIRGADPADAAAERGAGVAVSARRRRRGLHHPARHHFRPGARRRPLRARRGGALYHLLRALPRLDRAAGPGAHRALRAGPLPDQPAGILRRRLLHPAQPDRARRHLARPVRRAARRRHRAAADLRRRSVPYRPAGPRPAARRTRRRRARRHGGAHRLSAHTAGRPHHVRQRGLLRARDRGVRAVELVPAVDGRACRARSIRCGERGHPHDAGADRDAGRDARPRQRGELAVRRHVQSARRFPRRPDGGLARRHSRGAGRRRRHPAGGADLVASLSGARPRRRLLRQEAADRHRKGRQGNPTRYSTSGVGAGSGSASQWFRNASSQARPAGS